MDGKFADALRELFSSAAEHIAEDTRVLDDWILSVVKTVEHQFNERQTVRESQLYIPTPVMLKERKLTSLSADTISELFQSERTYIVISGEGGSGKTSLACQIAKWCVSRTNNKPALGHLIIPILLEEDLVIDWDNAIQSFLELVQGQIHRLTGDGSVDVEQVQGLLSKGRVLIIIDRLSEMPQTTINSLRFNLLRLPVRKLIVTSRAAEILGLDINPVIISPLLFKNETVDSFLSTYINARDLQRICNKKETRAACDKFSQLVGKHHSTVLLAKLFAELFVSTGHANDLPRGIPDLILHYANYLNRSVTDKKLKDVEVHRLLRVVGWHSLKKNFMPGAASIADLQAEFSNDPDLLDKLSYLVEPLGLVRWVKPSMTKIRFSLDPLAEYFAAMHVIEMNGEDIILWNHFLEDCAKFKMMFGTTYNFMICLYECCLDKKNDSDLWNFLISEFQRLSKPSIPTAVFDKNDLEIVFGRYYSSEMEQHPNLPPADIWTSMKKKRQQTGEPLSRQLLHAGYKIETRLANEIWSQTSMNYAKIELLERIDNCALTYLKQELVLKYSIVPILEDDGILLVMTKPLSTSAYSEVEESVKHPILEKLACFQDEFDYYVLRKLQLM